MEHILHCIERIHEDAFGGKEAVFASPTLQDSIVRNLQIMCESAQRLTESSKIQRDLPALEEAVKRLPEGSPPAN